MSYFALLAEDDDGDVPQEPVVAPEEPIVDADVADDRGMGADADGWEDGNKKQLRKREKQLKTSSSSSVSNVSASSDGSASGKAPLACPGFLAPSGGGAALGQNRAGGSPTLNWATLPPELLVLVFHFLRGTDLAAAEGACRGWRAMTVHWSETAMQLFVDNNSHAGSPGSGGASKGKAGERVSFTAASLEHPALVEAREVRRSLRRLLWHGVCSRAGFVADGGAEQAELALEQSESFDAISEYKFWERAHRYTRTGTGTGTGTSVSVSGVERQPDVVTVGKTAVTSHGRVDYRALYHAAAHTADDGPFVQESPSDQERLVRGFRVELSPKPKSFASKSFARTWQHLDVVRDVRVLRMQRKQKEGGEGEGEEQEQEEATVLWSRVHGGVLCEIPSDVGSLVVPQAHAKDFVFDFESPSDDSFAVSVRGVEIAGVAWIVVLARHRNSLSRAANLGEPREVLAQEPLPLPSTMTKTLSSEKPNQGGGALMFDSCFRVTCHAFSQELHRFQLAIGELRQPEGSRGAGGEGETGHSGGAWQPQTQRLSSRQMREQRNAAKRLKNVTRKPAGEDATDHSARTNSTDKRARDRRQDRREANFGADRDMFSGF
jgi:F-box-like